MKIFLTIIFTATTLFNFSQEIRRISKAGEDIAEKNKSYANAIESGSNKANPEIAYKGKDSLIFKKELEDFFTALENALRSKDGSLNFIKQHKTMGYIIFISNTGYIDAFYYDFEDGKLKIPFMGALDSFIANYKWPATSHQKFVYSGTHFFN